MRRILGPLTAVVAAAVLPASAAPARSVPTVKLMVATMSPFVVVGSGFQPRESVRVAVRADESSSSKSVTASIGGDIVVRFLRLKLERCAEFVVAARGNRGSSVRVHRVPRACGIDPRAG